MSLMFANTRPPQSDCALPHTSPVDFVNAGDQYYQRHLDPTCSLNMLDRALNEYAKALELAPDSPDVLAKVARILIRQGDYVKASQWAKRALALQKDLPLARFILGYVDYKAGNYSPALAQIRQAVHRGGLESGKWRLILFSALWKSLGQKQGLSLPTKLGRTLSAAYHLGSGLLLLPFERERLGLKNTFRLLPGAVRAWFLEETGQKRKALAAYQELHNVFPGISSLMNIIGGLHAETNQPEEAQHWFNHCLLRHPGNEEALFQIAAQLEASEQYEETIETYERLLKLRPNDAHLHCSLANTYYLLEQFEQAVTHYQTALKLGGEPKWRALLAQSLGNIYMENLQNPQAAQMAFEMAIDLDGREVENYIQLGLLYFQMEDHLNAQLVYEAALKIAPRNPKLYSNLGYLRWLDGDLEKAVQYYEKALTLDPSYEIPLNNLGVIYLDALGDVHQAIGKLEQAIRINDNYALAYYNLGRAYSFIDKRLEAATYFQKAQELNAYTRELDNEELDARISYLFAANEPRESA